MVKLHTRALQNRFGAEILDLDLNTITAKHGFAAIRAAFEQYSLLLFRGQNIDDKKHIELAKLFGPLEDRQADEHQQGEAGFEIPRVSNVKADGELAAVDDVQTLNLRANFLWHTDSTFLPVPALSNLIVCRVPSADGGATELASTRAAWADMPESLKKQNTRSHRLASLHT